MRFCFGDIVIVEGTLIGVICKSWCRDNRTIYHEVYVREYSCIKEYEENEIERYMVRHKELNDEEIAYQYNAINPFVTDEAIKKFLDLWNKKFGDE